MLDETVETRRPWRGSPHPCVHAGVFLRFMGIISTVSKPLRYSRFGRVRVHPCARGLRPYVVALNVRIWVHLRILLDLLGSAYYIKYNDYSEPLRTKKHEHRAFLRMCVVWFWIATLLLDLILKIQQGSWHLAG